MASTFAEVLLECSQIQLLMHDVWVIYVSSEHVRTSNLDCQFLRTGCLPTPGLNHAVPSLLRVQSVLFVMDRNCEYNRTIVPLSRLHHRNASKSHFPAGLEEVRCLIRPVEDSESEDS